jgi:trans-aconitate methyltransferase
MEARMLDQDLTTSSYWNSEWTGGVGIARTRLVTRRVHRRRHPLPALIASLLRDHRSGPVDVLEVGCAPGLLLAQFHSHRPYDRLHGVDFASVGLAQTKKLLENEHIDVTLHQCDVRRFEPCREYGVVYSCGLIEHFSDPGPILAHHVRLCAQGGMVAVSVPNYSGRIQHWFIRQLDASALESHNLQIMNTGALAHLLRGAGLKNVVAGYRGLALIRSRVARPTLWKKFLRRIAQAWNLGSTLAPSLAPWRNVVWAYGRKA